MSKPMYPITANCNFESRGDAAGQAIHNACKAVESGRVTSADLIEAMEFLEETLTDHADSGSTVSVELCAKAEAAVVAAYNAVKE